MNPITKTLKVLDKPDPPESFWNWNQDHKKPKSKTVQKWRLDEKRFSPNELFNKNPTKNAAQTPVLLGPGSGAGVGCGVGFGFGLVGGAGVSGWGWNHLRIAFGFGFGCGVGVGIGYGNGFGYESSWDTIKSDVFGFKKKKDPRNRVVTYM